MDKELSQQHIQSEGCLDKFKYLQFPFPLRHMFHAINRSLLQFLRIDKFCLFVIKHVCIHNISFKNMKKNVVLYEANQQNFLKSYQQNVIKGLSKPCKTLPFEYNYDEEGSNLCALIQQCPEYYLWSKDKKLLEEQGDKMLQMIGDSKFNLVDLGAGDATKTRILIKKALDKGLDIEYVPIDISYHANMGIIEEFKELFPTLRVTAITSLFEDGLEWVKKNLEGKSAIFFVGSTFGNIQEVEEIHKFTKMLYENMKIGDLFYVGFDRFKDPQVITRAYLDGKYEKPFIMNNLKRINKELGGNFNMEKFYPYCYFDPFHNFVRGVIVSKENQKVKIGETQICFYETETVSLYISRKWVIKDLDNIFEASEFTKKEMFTDKQDYFAYISYQK